jgi:hypothetical protein
MARCSIVNFHQCRLEFSEHFRACGAFSCNGVVEICGVNSGLGGEFSQADFAFLDGLLGSRKDFGGLFLLFLKIIDCCSNSGD